MGDFFLSTLYRIPLYADRSWKCFRATKNPNLSIEFYKCIIKAKGEIARNWKKKLQVFGYAGHGIVVVNWKQFSLLIYSSSKFESLTHSQLLLCFYLKDKNTRPFVKIGEDKKRGSITNKPNPSSMAFSKL